MVKPKLACRPAHPTCAGPTSPVQSLIPNLVKPRLGSLAAGAILALGLVGCGEATTPLSPLENAFLRADDFEITGGSPTAGAVGPYLQFNVRRQRDNQILNRPFNVYVENAGLAEGRSPLVDTQNRPILLQRSVAFLGNGLDLNRDGQPGSASQRTPQPQ